MSGGLHGADDDCQCGMFDNKNPLELVWGSIASHALTVGAGRHYCFIALIMLVIHSRVTACFYTYLIQV